MQDAVRTNQPAVVMPASDSISAKSTNVSTQTDTPLVLTLEATRFTYTPSVLRVKIGQNVTIQVINTDQTHGIRIRELGISGTKSINFIAPAPGMYEFSCPTMCGSGHGDMHGTLIVE